jgi:hypothetical protein
MDDLRARLRDADRQSPGVESYAHLYLGALAFLGFVIGAAVVLFLPTSAPTTPSAPASTIQNAKNSESVREPPLPAKTSAATGVDYTADPVKLASAADGVCYARAQARYPSVSRTPRLSSIDASAFDLKEIKHFNEVMTCLLTESPVRYCAPSERTMITAEIITYFRSVDNLKKALAAKSPAEKNGSPGDEPEKAGAAEVDAGVVAAIGARLRDGLLRREDFDRMKGSMPPRIRDRLAAVPIGKSHCPAPPWWAFWQ